MMIEQIRLINGGKLAVSNFNKKLESNQPLEKAQLSAYRHWIENAASFDRTYESFYKKSSPADSMFHELKQNLLAKTMQLMDEVDRKHRIRSPFQSIQIDLYNLTSIAYFYPDFSEEIRIAQVESVRKLQELFNEIQFDLHYADQLMDSFNYLKKICLYEYLVTQNSNLGIVIAEAKLHFTNQLDRCLNDLLSSYEEAHDLEVFYRTTEECLSQIQTYEELGKKIREDQVKTVYLPNRSEDISQFRHRINTHALNKQKTLKALFKYIEELTTCPEDKGELLDAVKELANLIKEIEYSKQFAYCSKLFKFNLLNEYLEYLIEKRDSLEDEGLQAAELLQLVELLDRIQMVKAFKKFDSFMPPDKSFASLHDQLISQLKKVRIELFDESKRLIEGFNYESLANKMKVLSLGEPIDVESCNRVNTCLENSIEAELKQAKKNVILMESLSLSDIGVILGGLEKLEKALKYLKPYLLHSLPHLLEIESQVKELLNKRVSDYLNEVIELIQGLNMPEADKRLTHLNQACRPIYQLIDQDLSQQISQLKHKQQDLTSVDMFTNLDLKTCVSRSRRVYENLNGDVRFQQTLIDLENVLCEKFANQLEAADIARLKMCEELAGELPDSLRPKVLVLIQTKSNQLEGQLLNFLQSLENNLKHSSFKIEAALESFNGFEKVKVKLHQLITNCGVYFEQALSQMDLIYMRNIFELVSFINNPKSLDQMRQQLQDKVELKKNSLLQVNLIKSSENFVKFEKFFEGLKNDMDLFTELNKHLKQHLFSVDFDAIEQECLDSLKSKLNREKINANSNLKSILLHQDGVETAKSFIVNYYNLVAFEATFGFDLELQLLETVMNHIERLVDSIELLNFAKAVEKFIGIKEAAIKLFVFKEKIDARLDKAINAYVKANGGFGTIGKLGVMLKSDKVGSVVMSEHKIFESFHRSLFNRKTLSQDIEYVLRDLTGTQLDKEELRKCYTKFKTTFDGLVEKYLAPTIDFDNFLVKLDKLVAEMKPVKLSEWNKQLKTQLPDLIGYIFALWTLLNSASYFDMQNSEEHYHFMPHPAQVVAIFRMLGIGYLEQNEQAGLTKNLAQVSSFFHNSSQES